MTDKEKKFKKAFVEFCKEHNVIDIEIDVTSSGYGGYQIDGISFNIDQGEDHVPKDDYDWRRDNYDIDTDGASIIQVRDIK